MEITAPVLTSTIEPLPGPAHHGHCGLDEVQGAEEVHVEDAAPRVVVGLGDGGPVPLVVGVLHEVVEAAEALDRGRDQGPARVAIGDVGGHDEWLPPESPHLVGHPVERLGPAGGEHHVDAVAGEAESDAAAHSRSDPCDDCDLVLTEHQMFLSSRCFAIQGHRDTASPWVPVHPTPPPPDQGGLE